MPCSNFSCTVREILYRPPSKCKVRRHVFKHFPFPGIYGGSSAQSSSVTFRQSPQTLQIAPELVKRMRNFCLDPNTPIRPSVIRNTMDFSVLWRCFNFEETNQPARSQSVQWLYIRNLQINSAIKIRLRQLLPVLELFLFFVNHSWQPILHIFNIAKMSTFWCSFYDLNIFSFQEVSCKP